MTKKSVLVPLILLIMTIFISPAYAQGPVAACDPNSDSAWTLTSPLQVERYSLSAVATSNNIYAIGGADYNEGEYIERFTNVVEYSAIYSDGSLSPWSLTSPIQTARAGAGVAINGTHIYIAGGRDSSGFLNSVEVAEINPDGSLGPWSTLAPMIRKRDAFSLVITHDYLYAVIGDYFEGNQFERSVERASIAADGSLGNWEVISTPYGTAFDKTATALVVNDILYTVKDQYCRPYQEPCDGDFSIGIEYAPINADGGLGIWNSVLITDRVNRYGNGAATFGGYLYVIGGEHKPARPTDPLGDGILSAPINDDGSVGRWQPVNTLNYNRKELGVVSVDKFIYAIGGRNSFSSVGVRQDVEYWNATSEALRSEYGVSINNGAVFTNDINVSLTIGAAPPWTDKIQVSNDGGFFGATWEPYTSCKPWQIIQYGNYVIPRTVYIRYKNAQGNISSTYQDDIILDMNPPTGSVEVLVNNAQVANERIHLTDTPSFSETVYLPIVIKPGAGPVTLRLTASDDVSGVAQMIIWDKVDFTGATWEPYKETKEWSPQGPTIYAKFKDHAGNISETVAGTVPQ